MNPVAFRAVMSPHAGESEVDDPANTIHEAHAFFRQVARAWSHRGIPATTRLVKRFNGLRTLGSLLNLVSTNVERGNAQLIFEPVTAYAIRRRAIEGRACPTTTRTHARPVRTASQPGWRSLSPRAPRSSNRRSRARIASALAKGVQLVLHVARAREALVAQRRASLEKKARQVVA